MSDSTNKLRPSESILPRRRFLEGSTAALAASALPYGAFAASKTEELKIALIGCGGRGTGATAQALQAEDNVKLWAMADAFESGLEKSRQVLEKGGKISRSPDGLTLGDKVDVPPERRFIGLDAYRQVMAMDEIDVVILTTPPGFRPIHFEAAIKAGKHVFMEKPVAVDGPGIRKVLAAAKEAKAKNLKVGVGLNRRHSPLHNDTMNRLHDGAIGDIHSIRLYNCRSGVGKYHKRLPSETELEYQVGNWYYFTWLSGDFIVEQSVHDYDLALWIMKEETPVSCQGLGGRLVRTGADYGHIYDHFYVEYKYASGARIYTEHRHIPKCWSQFGAEVAGSKGQAGVISKQRAYIQLHGEDRPSWRDRESGNSYQIEHDRLFEAIRKDLPHNEAQRGAHASLLAIMGRMAAYTGQELSWNDALASETNLVTEAETWDGKSTILPDADGRYPVDIPGRKA